MIVVEGPDGSGKSTLLNELSYFLNKRVLHTGGPKKDLEILVNELKKIQELKDDVLFDRVPYISDCIYRKIRGEVPLIEEEVLHGDLVKMNPKIIYCRLFSEEDMFNNISKEKKHHKSKEQMEEVIKNYIEIVNEYDRVMESLENKNVKIFRYNWQVNNIQHVLKFLES